MEAVKNSTIDDTRRRALEQFKRVGFPSPKDEEYLHIPVTQLLSRHFSEQEQITPTPSTYNTVAPFLINEVSNNRLVFVNGILNRALSSWEGVMNKMNITTLKEATKIHPQLIADHFGKYDTKDPFALFNSAQWQDGVLIHIPKNIIIEEPIVVYHLHDAQAKKTAAHTRLLIIAEPHSELTLVEKTNSIGSHPVFSTLNEEIVIQKQASLHYYNIQDDKGLLHRVTNTSIHQSCNSRVATHVVTLSGKLIRNNLRVQVDGTGCTTDLYGLYLLRDNALVDNHTTVDHSKPGSTSDELYKGIMQEKAKGIFNGKIYVRSEAQQTSAFQSNQNILLSETATLHAKPQLEIWADDVKCSHGCTSGQLDSEALFYMQSRGIPKSTSQALLLRAFAGEIVESIANDNLKKIVHNRIADELLHHVGYKL